MDAGGAEESDKGSKDAEVAGNERRRIREDAPPFSLCGPASSGRFLEVVPESLVVDLVVILHF
jgi:hypothetical protein